MIKAKTSIKTSPEKEVTLVYKTRLRQFIIETLEESLSPLSSLEIYNRILDNDLNCDRSTVYRQLEKLLKEGLILQLDLMDGKKRYELKRQSHHHHLVCNSCKKAICIQISESELEKIIMAPVLENGFKVTSHVLEFFGICNSCAKNITKYDK